MSLYHFTAERHEHEAQTGEEIGIMQIIKEGIFEIKDKISMTSFILFIYFCIVAHKGHLEEGEIEPIEDPHAHVEKPGIIATVKNSVHELKERAGNR